MKKNELKDKALNIVVSMNVREARKAVRALEFIPLLREVIEQEEDRDGRASVIADAEKRIKALTKGKEPKKTCPICKAMAYTGDEVEHIFGYRNMKSGKKTIKAMQSYCRTCRSAKAKKRRQDNKRVAA